MANVPFAEVEFLLQNLVDFIRFNYGLISEAEETINKLDNELRVLKGFSEYLSRSGDNLLRGLNDNLRNLVYQAEDVVEEFIAVTGKHKLRGPVGQLLYEPAHQLQVARLIRQMKDITRDIKEVYDKKAPLAIQHRTEFSDEKLSPAEAVTRKAAVDGNVVGLHDETERVIGLLTEGTKQLDVIAIVGMYGSGKTILAKKVYSDPRTEFQFFIRAFVEASQDFNMKEVFLKIIDSITGVTEDIQNMPEDKLADFIHQFLLTRKYLIVLDDVWTKEAWDQLKGAFPVNNKNSRILITTQVISVAEHARKLSEPLHKRYLSTDESRELLRLKVFDDPKHCPGDLLDVEERILRRCEGLPQTIVEVAGMLRSNRRDVFWWKKMADGVINYDPVARELSDNAILLRFDSLPYSLKPCFLYLGVFPEETEISSRTLLRLWVSEGLIPASNGSLSLEDIAAYYLDGLIDRNLVIVQKRSPNGQVKTIRIGVQLHKFCKDYAQKENLLREINTEDMSIDIDRRLCINSDLPNYVRRKPSGKRVRSFLCFAKRECTLPLDQISSILRAFKLLRVLDIRSIKLTRFPSSLCDLVLLRYIRVYGELKSLPERMSNFWNLQTLIVHTSAGTALAIKADIWKMEQLRNLETDASATLLEPTESSRRNANLQTLSTISPQSCKEIVFERTPKLRKLGIRGKLTLIFKDERKARMLFTSLSRLSRFENLKLLNNTREKISMLPTWDLFPGKLAKLTLLNTLLDWQHMNTLGKLENLQVLKLKDYAFEGPVWNTEEGGFKRLQVLHIGETDLSVWKATSSDFPVLSSLYIKRCRKLVGIPEGLRGVSSLQMIDLYYTNELLVHTARRFEMLKLKSTDKFKLFVHPLDD